MWLGMQCNVESADLERWAEWVEQTGRGMRGSMEVAMFLRKAAELTGGRMPGAGVNMPDRLREVEGRAAAAVERMRMDVSNKAAAIVGKALGKGVDLGLVMSAAGMDGWRDGSAAGMRNGGEANRRRARVRGGGVAAGGEVVAERGKAPLTPASAVARDYRYGNTWEGWAADALERRGFKIRHVARGVGLNVTECWRHLSGFRRHWRREALKGKAFPGVPAEWLAKLETAEALAKHVGVKGRPVVLNGPGSETGTIGSSQLAGGGEDSP